MKVIKETRMNTHQTHLEDLVLLGKDGFNELNDKIDKFLRRFDNSNKELNLTQKVDGSPALFVWHKFSGYPDNSIALKGFTSGPNTAMSSEEQIDAKYADRPGMAEKLKLGLQLAKYIPEGECWQGDYLFSHDDIREEEINGKNYLTFQPNKIVYAFSEENADYDKVANSDFGICFHTIYKDAGDGNKSQSFDVDPTRINAPNNFYIMSPAINVSSNKADYDTDSIEKEYEKLKTVENKLLNDSAYEDLINNQVFMNYWNTFENASLADKKQVNLNASTVINDLKSYVRDKQEKEYDKKIGSLKTDVGKQKATDKFNRDVQELTDLIDNNKSTITNIVEAINLAANIKMSMWAGLKQAKNDYSTFYRSRTKGYFPAEGEGIAMSDMNGNIVKIVDRSSFSSYNRDPDIMSGFEHVGEDLNEDIGDIQLDSKLEKLLGNNKQKFIDKVIEMILDKSYLDYFTYGLYHDDGNKKHKAVHDFWLNNFGLDTSLRGVGSKINSAILSIESSIEDTDEYKDSLDWDDTKRLSKDEQFKMNLFYEWDAIRKDPFGDYSDDDPRKSMSFREFLQDKLNSGDYEDDYEKQLLIKTIEEVKGGSGYFREMLATQRGDMGSFNKFSKKLVLDEDGSNKVAVMAFGRLNPPSIGHRKLAKKMASLAKDEKPKLYLSHKIDSSTDPLSYGSKVKWAEKELGDLVDVVESDAKNVFQALHELYDQGYTDIIYVGGDDRIGGSGDYSQQILNYNGKTDKNGNLVYKFNSITPVIAGERNVNSNNPEEKASASLLRKLVVEDNFDEFKKFVYLNDSDAYRLFKELKYAMKGKEESFLEAANNRIFELREASRLTKSKYTPEVQDALDKELDKIDTRLNAPDRNKGAEEYKNDIDNYTGLFVKQSSDAGVVYSEKDINKLFPNGDKINDALAELEISVNGNDYKLSSTGSAVLGEDNFSSEETTIYQEAISGLILAGRIEAPDVKKYLKESDDIFNYINVNGKDSSKFKSKWSNFVNKWGSTFNIEQAQKSTFINKANSILKGDVTNADILHPGVKSPYSAKAGILLSGADTFDKSDVYYCTGDTEKILDAMIAFRKNKDIKGYVQFMVDNSSNIIGVSLKKVSKTLRAEWDIPPKDASDFTKVYWPKTDALTQGLVFDVGDNSYLLAIRPNSKKAGDKGTLEWKEVGGSAQMGKAVTPVRKHLGDEFFSALSRVMVEKNYIQACKMLLKVLTGKNAEQGEVYNLTDEGKNIISKIFNDGCGFNSTDESGTRMSAPYIKVY